MKRILILMLALLSLGAVQAAGGQQFVLGSCDHKIAGGNGYGSDNAGEIAAAIYVPATRLSTLAGNDISRIDVGLISRINVRELTVWVRHSLDGSNLASATIDRGQLGWNEITLDQPYRIEAECPGLYIGFSYANAGSSHPVSFVGNAGEYSSFLRTGQDKQWTEMTSTGALSLEAIVTGSSLPQYDLALTSTAVWPDLSAGNNVYGVSGTVTNMALEDVSGFSITISSGEFTSAPVEIPVAVPTGATVRFSATVDAGTALSGDVTVNIAELFDGQDANAADNSMVTKIAFPRNVLVEEFTTELCPNCPEAAEYFHNVLTGNEALASRMVTVCHHSGFGVDWLTRDCDNDLLWMFDLDGKSFAPSAMFDRQPIFKRGLSMDRFEPIVALRSQDDIEECVAEALEIPAHVMLSVSVLSLQQTADGHQATVEVKAITDGEYDAPAPMLTFYTLEDNVASRAQQGTTDTGFLHQHVIRTDNGAWGEEVEFDGNTFSKTFTIDLDPSWNHNNISFAAFIANRDPEVIGNNIVGNAASCRLSDMGSSVETVSDTAATETARYDISGSRLVRPAKGVNIVVFSDGTTRKEIIL